MIVFKWLWRIARGVLLTLAAIVLFIEEWGWRPLTALAARISRWPPLAWLEARIANAPPWLALVLFIVPAVLLFPVKLLALWLIHEGRAALGVAVIVAAKVIGTALVGRLFVLTERQLMQFAWFARGMAWWIATKQRVKASVVGSPVWRAARAAVRRVRAWTKLRVRRLVR
ncbi:MAG TPA: hypothetical protein VJO99_02670 [Burkholderiaceae bacterium]|nr:hypothetical protein [Burkholderiaceae bacterium]